MKNQLKGSYAKRITLFVLTNLAVVAAVGIVGSLLGVDTMFARRGVPLNLGSLLVMSAVMGFAGSLISLALSKTMAKWSTGAKVIEQPRTPDEVWLVETVRRLAQDAGIGMPEVAAYDSPDMNAFATGARRDHALVAVSTGLLRGMRRDEVEAVLGHEIAHVANGDMVTLTLLQGVLNTFVIFLSRVVSFFVDRMLQGDRQEDRGGGVGPAYFLTSIVLQIVFGIGASVIVAWFSRRREFRADDGGAQLVNPEAMASALNRLRVQHGEPALLPGNMQAFGIRGGVASLFSSHPPLELRIQRLRDGSWRQ
jgi:heat shock protein HtpX